MPTTTATEMLEERPSRELQIALIRLFEGLRHFVRVHPIRQQDKLPEHDIVWVDELSSGPAQTLRDAIGASPALWAHALPAECCIVPISSLKKLIGEDGTEALGLAGQHMTITKAMRTRYEIEDRERRERHSK